MHQLNKNIYDNSQIYCMQSYKNYNHIQSSYENINSWKYSRLYVYSNNPIYILFLKIKECCFVF